MRKKKVIRLFAYLEKNLGDDLMVDILLKRYPKYIFFYDDWWNESDRFLIYPNFINRNYIEKKVHTINTLCNILIGKKHNDFFLRKVLQWIRRKCVCTVYIGGSIYIEGPHTDINKRMENEENKTKPSPLFVIGANFGPYRTSMFLERYREYFKKCKSICFRDMLSYNLFKDNHAVKYAPDVVFNLKTTRTTNRSNAIVLSIINLQNRPQLIYVKEKYEQLICDMCRIITYKGLTPVIVSFCDKEGDFEAAKRCYMKLERNIQEKVKLINYNGDIERILEVFETADSVIATRFHAMILALLFGKPFYCIAYDKKTSNVLEDIGCNQWISLEEIDIGAEEMLNKMDTYNLNPDYISLANNQFSSLDEFLRGIN